MKLLIIRHGITDWNLQGRIQGWTDIPLNDQGRLHFAACALPAPWQAAPGFTSTLLRSIETAQLLKVKNACAVPELREMHWGQWEGQTLKALRQSLGERFTENERNGLDFRPEGGESPREVRDRLQAWLAELALELDRVVIVTHKGVIRAALSLACGWDMRQKFNTEIDWRCGHEFDYHRAQGLTVGRLNVSLQVSSVSGG